MNRAPRIASLVLAFAPLAWLPGEVCAQAPSAVRGQPSVSDTYLEGYMTMLEGDKLRKAKDFVGAYFKYRDARDTFDSVHAADASWNAEIVDYRRRKIRESMTEVKAEEEARVAGGGAPSPKGVIGSARNADPKAPLEIREAIPAQEAPSIPRTPTAVLEERNRALQAQIERLEKRNEQIFKSLGAKEEEARRTSQERLRSQANEKALKERLIEAETRLQTADKAEKRRHADLLKKVEELQTALNLANEKLATAVAERDQMATERDKAIMELKSMSAEVTTLRKERDQLMALMSGGDGVKGVEKSKMLEENRRLKLELAAAQEKMKTLSTEKESDKKEIAALKDQVQSVQESLATMQKENEDYRAQIASLAGKLESARQVLAETSDGGGMSEGEAMAENNVLREIILQQLKQQSRREKARENLMAELQREGVFVKMKEMGVESDVLLRAVNEMAAPLEMTRDQRDILASTQVNKIISSADGKELIIVNNSNDSVPAPDAPPAVTGAADKAGLSTELKAYANAAEEHFAAGDFSSAERAFRKILTVEPQNVYALCNLGVAQLRLNNNEEAADTLMRAQAYNFDLEFPHFARGVALLRLGRFDDAVEELTDALKLNDKNAAAWHTLGLIAIKRGQREQAKENFLKAVALDSNCAEAHFNLAVIFATEATPQFDAARRHYKAAINSGAARDSGLDKLLGMR
jgi:tetratricopeptide (TPR) repeat protein